MESYPTTGEGVKRISEAPRGFTVDFNKQQEIIKLEVQLDALEWARKFMNDYERKQGRKVDKQRGKD